MSGSKRKIEQWEIDRYWGLFSSMLAPGSNHLSGTEAATVLKNSRLREDQLERVWDLADVDNDGRLDFEEFCVAMRLCLDLVNGDFADVPPTLPDWLVPESKSHLVQASRAIGRGHERASALDEADDDDGSGLKDGFDWYMSPAQRSDYDDIYSSARDGHGYVTFDSLGGLYSSLEIPDTDVHSAWNLVNPSADTAIGKDAALAFLHVLRGRHDGYRLPKTVPPSLRASFEHRGVDFNVERVRSAAASGRADESTSAGRKAKFGDSYLSRLGTGGGGYRPKGTDFSGTKTTEDWEEVRLKKQLRELESKIERVEAAARNREQSGRRGGSKPALVKRELEQLLDWKRRELRDLETGEGHAEKEGKGLKVVEEDISTIRDQIDGLEQHLRRRKDVLEGLRRQVQEEKGR